MITARPQKLLIKDDPTKNNLILVYDLEKETVTVRYLNKDGKEIAPVKTKDVQVGKIYEVNVERIYIDGKLVVGFNQKKRYILIGKYPSTHARNRPRLNNNRDKVMFKNSNFYKVIKSRNNNGWKYIFDSS